MNFQQFQAWRQHCLASQPGLIDCGETRLHRVLQAWQLQPRDDTAVARIFRCDLARAWVSRCGWPPALARRALVCQGVRHALRLIFQQLARDQASLCLPSDVYPVYASVAADCGLPFTSYPSLPRLDLPAASSVDSDRDEFLLLCNPCKPLGRYLSASEMAGLRRWLQQSARRHLVLDCVYDLGSPLHETSREWAASGRAILLHSLAKTWLWPQTLGFALFPEALRGRFEPGFQADPPTPAQLRTGHDCLLLAPERPLQIAQELARRSRRLMQQLPAPLLAARLTPEALTPLGSYLFAVDRDAGELLTQHGILALPASAYGSARWPGSVLSSLAV